jgi:hypothetical protein
MFIEGSANNPALILPTSQRTAKAKMVLDEN